MLRGLLCSGLFVLVALGVSSQVPKPPSSISLLAPEFPEGAISSGISGSVLLSVVISKEGIPTNIKVVKPLGNGFDEKAVEAVARWRFKPAMRNGVATALPAQIEITVHKLNQRQQGAAFFDAALQHLRGAAGKPRSETDAFTAMQKAADLDYAPAQTRLGTFYLKGIGTPADPAKAAALFDKAAERHDAPGEYQLGTLYREGIGVPRDLVMAFQLFTRSADGKDPDGEFALARAYEKGEGVETDASAALQWYRQSAERNNGPAQQRLAEMNWEGKPVEALTWALLAERNGVKEATATIVKYEAALTKDQIAEAEKRAQELRRRK